MDPLNLVKGWQAIPGGKHGGQRRRVGGKWEYRYPEAGSGERYASRKETVPAKIGKLAEAEEAKAYSFSTSDKSAGRADGARAVQRAVKRSGGDPAKLRDLMDAGITEAHRQMARGGSEERWESAIATIRKLGEHLPQPLAKGEPMADNPLDLVNATPGTPRVMRQGSVTYHVADAHEVKPQRSIPSLQAPPAPAYEQAERDSLDLVNGVPRVNGVLTHPDGTDRRS